jgi:PIN domain nuclease of toxin-antitoxin system
MRLLLNTLIFLWYITANPQLPALARDAIRDAGNVVYLSVASVWEAVIKYDLQKLPLPEPPATFLPE